MNKSYKRACRRGILLGGAMLLAFLGAAPAEPPAPSLRILGRYTLPPGGSPFTDIRWATDNSVFVMRTYHGLEEIQVGPDLKTLRQPVPPVKVLGGFDRMARLGVSGQYIAFASEGHIMAWRSRDSKGPGLVVFRRKEIGLAEDIDLSDDRLVLLGTPYKTFPEAEAGVAWLGTLGSDLKDWKPLLAAPAGPDGERSAALFDCETVALGAVRFLADRSILVVPGFLPGAYQFDAQGNPVRTWSQQEIGLTTDCRNISDEVSRQLAGFPSTRLPWLNQRRVLEEILPFPQGPGLLIRSRRADGKITWELKILGSQGVATYALPIVGNRPGDRLRADVHNGKIALLMLSDFLPSTAKDDQYGELILAELPHSGERS
jgi:hypothetical protein